MKAAQAARVGLCAQSGPPYLPAQADAVQAEACSVSSALLPTLTRFLPASAQVPRSRPAAPSCGGGWLKQAEEVKSPATRSENENCPSPGRTVMARLSALEEGGESLIPGTQDL